MKDREVYWLEEIGQEYNDIVGKKSAYLGKALNVNGIQIPFRFTISKSACEECMNKTGIDKKIQQYFRQNNKGSNQ